MKIDNKKTAFIIFIVLAFIAVSPIFKNISYWGTNDWDQHFFFFEAARKTIVEYKQFPFWNPYYCGGNALLAHPESVFLYPMFLINLLFGTVVGVKIQIFLHLIIGMFGMWLLAKYFKMAKYSCYLPSMIFMLSSWFASRMFVGHTLYLTFTLLPYVFLFYLKSMKNIKNIIIVAIILMLMVLGGGTTYPIMLTLLFLGVYSFFRSIKNKNVIAIRNLAIIVILFVLFSAVKVFPMLKLINEFSQPMLDEQPTSFRNIYDSLLSRDQDYKSRIFYAQSSFNESYYQGDKLIDFEVVGRDVWAWHEYSAYVGFIAMILFLVGIYFYHKRHWDLIATSLVFIWLYLGYKFVLWKILIYLPLLKSLHGPSRSIMIFVFILAILAGLGGSFIEKRYKKNYVMIIILVLLLVDLLSISMSIYAKTFTTKPLDMEHKDRFLQIMVAEKFVSQFPNLLQNVGSINCYEKLHPAFAASPIIYANRTLYPYYHGESYLLSENKTMELLEFKPNKFRVKVDSDKEDVLVLNQNYFDGWKVKDRDVRRTLGKVSTEVSSADKEIVFYYFPGIFILGLLVSIVSLVVGVWYYRRN